MAGIGSVGRRRTGAHWSGHSGGPDALRVLETYQWPGNIRQLINVIERGKILAEDQFITTDELPAVIMNPISTIGAAVPATTISAALADDGTLAAIEKARVVDVMQKQKGNKSRAAQVLGISRRSLYRLLEKYGLDGTRLECGGSTPPSIQLK